MNSLDLNIVKGVERDIDACLLLHKLLQLCFVGSLDLAEASDKVFVVSMLTELTESVHVADPLIDITDSLTDELRETWVAAVEPAARSHSICLVLDLAWLELVELREDRSTKQIRVKGCDTVDGVRADDGQVSHADLSGVTLSLFNERHAREFLTITRVLGRDGLKEVVIDLVDELHVSREQLGDQTDGPFLKGLWEHSVVGVCECVVDDVPGIAIGELLLINQNSQELDRRDSRMGIVELHLVLFSELRPVISVVLLVAADDVTK